MPGVRKITNVNSKKLIGSIISLKNGNSEVNFESPLERDFYYLLEFDKRVTGYQEQPCHIEYVLDGKIHIYTPDCRVYRPEKTLLVEVKAEEDVLKEENIAVWQQVAQICRQQGEVFTIISSKHIRVEPRLDNIKLLYRYAGHQPAVEELSSCKAYFQTRGEVSLGEAADALMGSEVSRNTIYWLLFHEMLAIDLMQAIDDDSQIKINAFNWRLRRNDCVGFPTYYRSAV